MRLPWKAQLAAMVAVVGFDNVTEVDVNVAMGNIRKISRLGNKQELWPL
jgi:hypothetical protein